MAIISKPDMTNLWASGGAIIAPSASKVQTGWTAEIPPHQWENWVQNRQDEAIAYLFQRGIPEWDATTEYSANGSYVQWNGKTYKAIANNINVPPSNTSSWKVWGLELDDLPSATTTTKGVIEIATNAETATGTDTTRAVTPAGLTSRTALESRTGLVQLATTAEARALINDTNALTPKKLGDAIQPTVTGFATFTRASNQIQFTGVASLLALEVGDVIEISGSADNSRLHTVESIIDNNTIVVNYEHRNGAGSLSLIDETTNVTIKRIAKWFNAPIGLGQAWVDMRSSRNTVTTYTNTSGRTIGVGVTVSAVGSNVRLTANVGGLRIMANSGYTSGTGSVSYSSVSFSVPLGSIYQIPPQDLVGSVDTWAELR